MKILKTLALGLCLLPIAASAQSSVEMAFDILVDNPKAEIIQNHSLLKDPVTGEKESQCDIYNFTLSKKQMDLVKDIEQAFLTDSEDAYQFATGKRSNSADSNSVLLVTGKEASSAVEIAREPGMNYVYACFLAPEDTTHTHRYAYAMEWKTTAGGDAIVGRLVVTYAKIPPFRQERMTAKGIVSLTEDVETKLRALDNRSWIETLTSYITAMTTADLQTRRAFASKIYIHTKDLKNATESDKDLAHNLIAVMQDDKKRYDDQMIQALLSAAIKNLE